MPTTANLTTGNAKSCGCAQFRARIYPRGCGIYVVKHVASGRVYVGSTHDLAERLKHHTSKLRRGTHHIEEMQAIWDAEGAGAFVWELVETAAQSELLACEQAWLDRMRATPAGVFNRSIVAANPAFATRGRRQADDVRAVIAASKALQWIVVTPDGAEHRIVNLKRFCREHGLPSGDMYRVARGQRRTAQGWRCRRDT